MGILKGLQVSHPWRSSKAEKREKKSIMHFYIQATDAEGNNDEIHFFLNPLFFPN